MKFGDCYDAYCAIMDLTFEPGDDCEALFTNMLLLAKRGGFTEGFLAARFMRLMPPYVFRELRSEYLYVGIDDLPAREIVAKAKALLSVGPVDATVDHVATTTTTTTRPFDRAAVKNRGCFRCGGPHLARFCQTKPTCYACGREGHVKRECRARNETRRAGKPAGSSREH